MERLAADPSVTYADVAGVLSLYVQAMCGRAVRADVAEELGTCDVVAISADEIRIRVPTSVALFPTRAENARFLRCLVSHQVGHAEFGTDRFRFDRPSRHFRDWRPRLARGWSELGGTESVPQVFGRLRDPGVARAIFFELEELRVEAAMHRTYPGVAEELRWFDRYRDNHPANRDLRWLRRLAHGQPEGDHDPTVTRMRSLTDRVRLPGASVEDTVEATLRVYAQVRRLGGAAPSVVEDQPETAAVPRRRQPASRRFGAPDPRSVARSQASAEGEEDDEDAEGGAGNLPVPPVQRPVVAAGRPFTYPEWDFRTQTYLRAHATVWERVGLPGPTVSYHAAIRRYARLLRDTRSRFEAIQAAATHDLTRDVDGDSFDLDALVDYAVARRTHDQSSEQIYLRRGALRRDVAALVLLDVSATTGEPILHRPGGSEGTDPPPDRHTILSVERAASIVMLKTADDLGDQVAMYAFSGLSRHGVAVTAVKEFGAAIDHRVASRIGGLRPQQATRMGAAVRHATMRLCEQPANRRLLFFVNDGRPFDVDYGRDDDDHGHAIADTRQALGEAVEAGIQPICLTVQAADSSYLAEMCGILPYEVVRYAEELPERLLAAYARLRHP